jgi:hypothetical protein
MTNNDRDRKGVKVMETPFLCQCMSPLLGYTSMHNLMGKLDSCRRRQRARVSHLAASLLLAVLGFVLLAAFNALAAERLCDHDVVLDKEGRLGVIPPSIAWRKRQQAGTVDTLRAVRTRHSRLDTHRWSY